MHKFFLCFLLSFVSVFACASGEYFIINPKEEETLFSVNNLVWRIKDLLIAQERLGIETSILPYMNLYDNNFELLPIDDAFEEIQEMIDLSIAQIKENYWRKIDLKNKCEDIKNKCLIKKDIIKSFDDSHKDGNLYLLVYDEIFEFKKEINQCNKDIYRFNDKAIWLFELHNLFFKFEMNLMVSDFIYRSFKGYALEGELKDLSSMGNNEIYEQRESREQALYRSDFNFALAKFYFKKASCKKNGFKARQRYNKKGNVYLKFGIEKFLKMPNRSIFLKDMIVNYGLTEHVNPGPIQSIVKSGKLKTCLPFRYSDFYLSLSSIFFKNIMTKKKVKSKDQAFVYELFSRGVDKVFKTNNNLESELKYYNLLHFVRGFIKSVIAQKQILSDNHLQLLADVYEEFLRQCEEDITNCDKDDFQRLEKKQNRLTDRIVSLYKAMKNFPQEDFKDFLEEHNIIHTLEIEFMFLQLQMQNDVDVISDEFYLDYVQPVVHAAMTDDVPSILHLFFDNNCEQVLITWYENREYLSHDVLLLLLDLYVYDISRNQLKTKKLISCVEKIITLHNELGESYSMKNYIDIGIVHTPKISGIVLDIFLRSCNNVIDDTFYNNNVAPLIDFCIDRKVDSIVNVLNSSDFGDIFTHLYDDRDHCSDEVIASLIKVYEYEVSKLDSQTKECRNYKEKIILLYNSFDIMPKQNLEDFIEKYSSSRRVEIQLINVRLEWKKFEKDGFENCIDDVVQGSFGKAIDYLRKNKKGQSIYQMLEDYKCDNIFTYCLKHKGCLSDESLLTIISVLSHDAKFSSSEDKLKAAEDIIDCFDNIKERDNDLFVQLSHVIDSDLTSKDFLEFTLLKARIDFTRRRKKNKKTIIKSVRKVVEGFSENGEKINLLKKFNLIKKPNFENKELFLEHCYLLNNSKDNLLFLANCYLSDLMYLTDKRKKRRNYLKSAARLFNHVGSRKDMIGNFLNKELYDTAWQMFSKKEFLKKDEQKAILDQYFGDFSVVPSDEANDIYHDQIDVSDWSSYKNLFYTYGAFLKSDALTALYFGKHLFNDSKVAKNELFFLRNLFDIIGSLNEDCFDVDWVKDLHFNSHQLMVFHKMMVTHAELCIEGNNLDQYVELVNVCFENEQLKELSYLLLIIAFLLEDQRFEEKVGLENFTEKLSENNVLVEKIKASLGDENSDVILRFIYAAMSQDCDVIESCLEDYEKIFKYVDKWAHGGDKSLLTLCALHFGDKVYKAKNIQIVSNLRTLLKNNVFIDAESLFLLQGVKQLCGKLASKLLTYFVMSDDLEIKAKKIAYYLTREISCNNFDHFSLILPDVKNGAFNKLGLQESMQYQSLICLALNNICTFPDLINIVHKSNIEKLIHLLYNEKSYSIFVDNPHISLNLEECKGKLLLHLWEQYHDYSALHRLGLLNEYSMSCNVVSGKKGLRKAFKNVKQQRYSALKDAKNHYIQGLKGFFEKDNQYKDECLDMHFYLARVLLKMLEQQRDTDEKQKIIENYALSYFVKYIKNAKNPYCRFKNREYFNKDYFVLEIENYFVQCIDLIKDKDLEDNMRLPFDESVLLTLGNICFNSLSQSTSRSNLEKEIYLSYAHYFFERAWREHQNWSAFGYYLHISQKLDGEFDVLEYLKRFRPGDTSSSEKTHFNGFFYLAEFLLCIPDLSNYAVGYFSYYLQLSKGSLAPLYKNIADDNHEQKLALTKRILTLVSFASENSQCIMDAHLRAFGDICCNDLFIGFEDNPEQQQKCLSFAYEFYKQTWQRTFSTQSFSRMVEVTKVMKDDQELIDLCTHVVDEYENNKGNAKLAKNAYFCLAQVALRQEDFDSVSILSDKYLSLIDTTDKEAIKYDRDNMFLASYFVLSISTQNFLSATDPEKKELYYQKIKQYEKLFLHNFFHKKHLFVMGIDHSAFGVDLEALKIQTNLPDRDKEVLDICLSLGVFTIEDLGLIDDFIADKQSSENIFVRMALVYGYCARMAQKAPFNVDILADLLNERIGTMDPEAIELFQDDLCKLLELYKSILEADCDKVLHQWIKNILDQYAQLGFIDAQILLMYHVDSEKSAIISLSGPDFIFANGAPYNLLCGSVHTNPDPEYQVFMNFLTETAEGYDKNKTREENEYSIRSMFFLANLFYAKILALLRNGGQDMQELPENYLQLMKDKNYTCLDPQLVHLEMLILKLSNHWLFMLETLECDFVFSSGSQKFYLQLRVDELGRFLGQELLACCSKDAQQAVNMSKVFE